MKNFISFTIILLLFVNCSTLKRADEYTSFEDSKKFKFLTISGQPNKQTLDDVYKNGFDIVLNLRNPGEFTDFDEAKYVKAKGLKYSNLPFFNENKEITEEKIQTITNFVEANRDKKIFIHCSSGNRASAWLLIHLHRDHNMSLDKSIQITSETGLTNDDLRNNVLEFIDRTK